jgi:hypothetical protein
MNNFFISRIPLPVMQFKNVRRSFQASSTFGRFLLKVRNFSVSRILELVQQDVGVLDQLVPYLDTVWTEPWIRIKKLKSHDET